MTGQQMQVPFASWSAAQAGWEEAGLLASEFANTLRSFGSASASTQAVLSQGLVVDAWVAVIYTVIIFILTWTLRKLFIEPIAGSLFFSGLKLRKQRQMTQKFTQSAMEAIAYGSFFMFGLVIVPVQPWSWPSAMWWQEWHAGPPSPHMWMRRDLRCYYILYGARYVSFGISGLLEYKRKDFIEMQVHHWVTVILVLLSYVYGWIRVGTIVMVLLDPADVPLHIAKMFKYGADAGGPRSAKFQFVADRLFEIFAVVFFISRLVLYPYTCWSAKDESIDVWSKEVGRQWEHDAAEWLAVILLFTLLVLQVYWFALIIRVAITMARTGKADDVRSDDEGEEPSKKAE
eukprot:CAMPEP_0178426556 /NCGR_PEP_ID=MMETSP0689_2-20121128/29294_1 /TAXON_ID=160604 /ORGANISM="Amphidinium massartii, Strain CS-259" /LENGTH=344 /DNA_ID=CAMNT_0020048243 /DNA_START=59 /DNA_END=1093 /DNA_ORIENTATION=-